eukprot:TRINITY_DN2239_c0_g1_i1.p1 TRINITY_DN2239_c0_g1~~TRINITY_DN2239_c0_g1_i1.p1  ORF type:complete len:594 (+),score=189.19 TRINITY_DN2239_c0_g1_i1:46-1782(+)
MEEDIRLLSGEGMRVEILQGNLGCMDESQLCWARGLKRIEGTKLFKVPFAVPDHYTRVEWLSAGAQGAIAKAHNTRSKEDVAIKMLSCEAQPRHVLRELRTMSLWQQHSNLSCASELYYHQRDQKMWVYIVMPLMAGSLDQWLDSFKTWRAASPTPQCPVPHDTVAMVAYQALRGVHYLHSGGVHHRDLAPKNLLFQSIPNGTPVIHQEEPAKLRVPGAVQRLVDLLQSGTAGESTLKDAISEACSTEPLLVHPLLLQHGWCDEVAGFKGDADHEALAEDLQKIYLRNRTVGCVDMGVDPSYTGPPLRVRVSVTDFGLSRSLGGESTGDVLTDYVVTRHYRAPELILGQGLQAYDPEKVDVWSLGCVVGEMAHPRLATLLPGRNVREQMEYIFLLLGVPEPEEVAPFATLAALQYVTMTKERERARGKPFGTDFSQFFAGASPECVDALRVMLALSPAKRASVSELLDMPFFRRGAALCGYPGDSISRTLLDPDVEGQIQSPGPNAYPETVAERHRRQAETRYLIIEEVHKHRCRAYRIHSFAGRSAESRSRLRAAAFGLQPYDIGDDLLHYAFSFVP